MMSNCNRRFDKSNGINFNDCIMVTSKYVGEKTIHFYRFLYQIGINCAWKRNSTK